MADQAGAKGERATVGPYDGPGSDKVEMAAGVKEVTNKPATESVSLPERVEGLADDGSIVDLETVIDIPDDPVSTSFEIPKGAETKTPAPLVQDKTTKDPYANPKDSYGAKKVPMSLIPPAAKIHMAMAFKDGAKKYGPYNWRDNKVIMSIYLDACQRHLDDFLDGEEVAEDSNVSHLGHAMACLAIILDAQENGMVVDDRPTVGAAPRLNEKFREK